MKKKIDYEFLKCCIEKYDFPVDHYNNDDNICEKGYPRITDEDYIDFLISLKSKDSDSAISNSFIYLEKEVKPKRIDFGEINTTYWEIWTNGCFPTVKIYFPLFQEQFKELLAKLKMPKKRKFEIICKEEKIIGIQYSYNTAYDYYGGSHSYGYDPSQKWTKLEIFRDICKIFKQMNEVR